MPHILITNDDGVFAPGLLALARALAGIARVTVIAPDRECSAISNALTTRSPLRLQAVSLNGGVSAWACSGTPVDSVKMGMTVVCRDDPPDLVMSGINPGSNLGSDILYSGTVGAAMDGVLLGKPAVAVSLCGGESRDFGAAADVARLMAQTVLSEGLPQGILLNVNVPPVPASALTGFRITAMGRGRFLESYEERRDPGGRPYYWIQGLRSPEPQAPDSDEAAVLEQAVSITPLRVDLTDRSLMDRLTAWNLSL